MLDSKSYKEYYVVASGAEPPKAKTKYKKKADEPVTPSKSKSAPAAKGTRLKTPAKVTQSSKKRQSASVPKAKGLAVLSKSKVPDEQQQKVTGTNKGAGVRPEVPNVPKYNSESEEESWTFSQNNEDDEESDMNDDSEETESDNDGDDLTHPNLSTYKAIDEEEEKEKADDDEVSSYQRVYSPPDHELTEEEKEKADDDEVSSYQRVYSPPDHELTEEEKEIKKFDQWVSALETELFEFRQTNQFSKAISSILSIVDNYLASKMKEAVYVVQAEVSKIMPKVKNYVTESLRAEVLSVNISDIQKNLYNALVESYNFDKDIFSTYGDVVTLKRGRDDQDKDADPFARSNQGSKRRRSGKEAESSKEPTHKESKSTSSSKDASRSQQKSSSKSDHTEEHDKVYRIWSPIKVVYDKHAYWGTYHYGPKHQKFYGYASNMETSKDVYSRHKIIVVTSLMKYFSYSYLEEIIVRRQDDQLYKFREGIIYEDEMNGNRLMRTDELHKFSDGTLNHVRTALNNIATGIEMDYLPNVDQGYQDRDPTWDRFCLCKIVIDDMFETDKSTWQKSKNIESIVNDSDNEEVENIFVEDRWKPMDGLVDDARKKAEAPPKKTLRKTGI
nr:hypothetical protein [Tanacetum cinerariifolium]